MGVLRSLVCAVVFLYLMLVLPLFCGVFYIVPIYYLLPSKPAQWLGSRFAALFLYQYGWMIEVLGGTKVVLTTDEPNTRLRVENTLLLCNHRSEVDWMFFVNICTRWGLGSSIKIVMKSVLRNVPGIGWVLRLFGTPFVERVWTIDQVTLQKCVEAPAKAQLPMMLCIYPEGTALYGKSQARSRDLMVSKGLEPFEYVLYPRIKGFVYCAKLIDNVSLYDMTIAFPDLRKGRQYRPTPLRILLGKYPSEIHIHINRYSPDTVPQTDQDLEKWLLTRFELKEKRLKEFYESSDPKAQLGKHQLVPSQSPNTVRLWTLISMVFYTASTLYFMRLVWSNYWALGYFVAICALMLFENHQIASRVPRTAKTKF